MRTELLPSRARHTRIRRRDVRGEMVSGVIRMSCAEDVLSEWIPDTGT